MLYVLWALLNLGLALYFIRLCFRATKLIRINLGLFASIVFALGLLSFIGSSGSKNVSENSANNQAKKWTFTPENVLVSNTKKFTRVSIDKTLLSTTDLVVLWDREKASTRSVPIEATSTTAGFATGHTWKTTFIRVDTTSTVGKLSYAVEGLLEWNLLGASIYVQPKTYTGFLYTNSH